MECNKDYAYELRMTAGKIKDKKIRELMLGAAENIETLRSDYKEASRDYTLLKKFAKEQGIL